MFLHAWTHGETMTVVLASEFSAFVIELLSNRQVSLRRRYLAGFEGCAFHAYPAVILPPGRVGLCTARRGA